MRAVQKTQNSIYYPGNACLQVGWLREAYGLTVPEERGEKEKRQVSGAGVWVWVERSQPAKEKKRRQ